MFISALVSSSNAEPNPISGTESRNSPLLYKNKNKQKKPCEKMNAYKTQHPDREKGAYGFKYTGRRFRVGQIKGQR